MLLLRNGNRRASIADATMTTPTSTDTGICPAGMYIPDTPSNNSSSSSSSSCQPVGMGYSSPANNNHRYPCTMGGTFSNITTAASCLICPMGSFAPNHPNENQNNFNDKKKNDNMNNDDQAVTVPNSSCQPCNPFYYNGPGSDYALWLTPDTNGSPQADHFCLEPTTNSATPAPVSLESHGNQIVGKKEAIVASAAPSMSPLSTSDETVEQSNSPTITNTNAPSSMPFSTRLSASQPPSEQPSTLVQTSILPEPPKNRYYLLTRINHNPEQEQQQQQQHDRHPLTRSPPIWLAVVLMFMLVVGVILWTYVFSKPEGRKRVWQLCGRCLGRGGRNTRHAEKKAKTASTTTAASWRKHQQQVHYHSSSARGIMPRVPPPPPPPPRSSSPPHPLPSSSSQYDMDGFFSPTSATATNWSLFQYPRKFTNDASLEDDSTGMANLHWVYSSCSSHCGPDYDDDVDVDDDHWDRPMHSYHQEYRDSTATTITPWIPPLDDIDLDDGDDSKNKNHPMKEDENQDHSIYQRSVMEKTTTGVWGLAVADNGIRRTIS